MSRDGLARAARWGLGFLIGLIVRAWLASLSLRVFLHPALRATAIADRPWVLAFFHGTQLPLLAWRRRRPTAVLVSLSADGDLQAGALTAQRLRVTRGSSSRGGARGLVALVRALRDGLDVAFAVDGPRGPRGVPKPGALAAARAGRAVVVPLGSASRRSWVLRRAWDRFAVPLPFTRVTVVLGAPLEPRETDEIALAQAIDAANASAEAALAEPDSRAFVERFE